MFMGERGREGKGIPLEYRKYIYMRDTRGRRESEKPQEYSFTFISLTTLGFKADQSSTQFHTPNLIHYVPPLVLI